MSRNNPFDLDKQYSGGQADRPLPLDAHTDANEIEGLFDTAFSRRPDSDFLSNIYAWWQEKSFLTESQYLALCKFAGENQ